MAPVIPAINMALLTEGKTPSPGLPSRSGKTDATHITRLMTATALIKGRFTMSTPTTPTPQPPLTDLRGENRMGNRGLLRALRLIAAKAQTQGRVKFGQVFLAAPDVVFLDLARLYPEHAERTTLYASNADLPVHLSSKLHDAPRAGYYMPYSVAPGVDTVAAPDFDVDLLGHSYFAQAEALLHDIHGLMRHNEAPAKRQRITPAAHKGTVLWKLRR